MPDNNEAGGRPGRRKGWVKELIEYLRFKFLQYKSRREARKNDPHIYPLW